MDLLEHDKLVFSIINKHTLPKDRDEDMTQEGRMGLVRALKTYKPERGGFSTWAYPIIQSHVCSEVKRRMQTPDTYSYDSERDSWLSDDGYNIVDRKDDVEFLLRFACPKEAIILRRLSRGETIQEIGLALGITHQGVSKHKKKGVERILRGIRGTNYRRELRPDR